MKPANRKWTKDTVIEIIKSCHSMKEFRKKHAYAYDVMKLNGWDDVKEYLLPNAWTYDNAPKWTQERIAELAAECTTLGEFREKYPRAYEKVKAKKWHALLSGLPREPSGIEWTREMIAGVISRCTSLSEFRVKHQRAYTYMISHKWHDLAAGLPRTFDSGMPSVWSVYRWYFPETNAVYIGLTNNYARRINEELKYSSASLVHDYIKEHGCSYEVTELYSGLSGEEASRLEVETIAMSRDSGYEVLNRNRGGTLGGQRRPYGIDFARYIVAKYDFRGNYRGSCVAETESAANDMASRMKSDGTCRETIIIPVSVPLCIHI